MTFSHRRRPHRSARPGFTTIEILVVIAILGILAALGSAAYFKWIETRRRDNTTQTILAIHELLKQQMKIVVDQANTEDIPAAALAAAIPPGNRTSARTLYVNARLAQEFPMTYAEAFTPKYGLSPKVAYKTSLTAAGKSASTASTTNTSSTLLLLALQLNRKGVSLNMDQFGGAIMDIDVPPDALNELIDGWGNALKFQRGTVSANAISSSTLSATITSAGPDGLFGTADDIIDSPTNPLRLGN